MRNVGAFLPFFDVSVPNWFHLGILEMMLFAVLARPCVDLTEPSERIERTSLVSWPIAFPFIDCVDGPSRADQSRADQSRAYQSRDHTKPIKR